MKNCNMKNCLREGHQITDFLWFMLVGVLPVFVACFAIVAKGSLLWLAGYLVIMLLLEVVEVWCLCRHCPYYRQQPGVTVHCKAMWGPTKWFKPKLGALSYLDKVILYSFFFISFTYPIYWLALQPELLVVYLWSIGIMVWTLGRYECGRCMHFHCPFNLVGEDVKEACLMEMEQ